MSSDTSLELICNKEDLPFWDDYTKNGGDCIVTAYRTAFGTVIVICSDKLDPDGASITNNADVLACAFCEKFEVEIESLIWIEHYPGEWIEGIHHEAIYDFVSFQLRDNVLTPSYHEVGLSDWNILGIPVPADFPPSRT